jgi:hypothetical protein
MQASTYRELSVIFCLSLKITTAYRVILFRALIKSMGLEPSPASFAVRMKESYGREQRSDEMTESRTIPILSAKQLRLRLL